MNPLHRSIFYAPVVSAAGVLSRVAYTTAGSRNLTTDGSVDWGWRVDVGAFRFKATGSTTLSCTAFGGGSNFTSFVGDTYTISDGFGGGFATADTNNGAAGKNMDASAGGFIWTCPIGLTQRTVEVEYKGGGGGNMTVTAVLSDGSATLGSFTTPADGSTRGDRFTVKAASAGQTLTVTISGTTGVSVSDINTGCIVIY